MPPVRIDGARTSPSSWPRLLAEVHRSVPVGAAIEVRFAGDAVPISVTDLLHGAGFEPDGDDRGGWLRAARVRTLPDFVGPGMGVLCCGLNPSVYAADAGVGYARPGNRFWPAAEAAGLACDRRDGLHALEVHGLGLTDLVKRATPAADALTAEEYRRGLARVDALCRWLEPAVVCFVGLAGWRAASRRSATSGWQEDQVGGRPTYVMPSTSGRNASSTAADLVEHLQAAAEGAVTRP